PSPPASECQRGDYGPFCTELVRGSRAQVVTTGGEKQDRGGAPLILSARVAGAPMTLDQRLQEIREGFERPFWIANISEIFERLSYYAAFASLARYLHEALSFPTERAANLASLFGGLVWFLAIFGGAIADLLCLR